MRFRTMAIAAGIALAWLAAGGRAASLLAQRGGMFLGSLDDPAIKYSTAPIDNPVVDLNKKLADGTVRLTFDGRSGYLQSALDALSLPVESQMLVFSPTSFQARRINAGNPRALFYNDSVELGWVRDGDVLEVAAQDAHEGVVFYTLDQRPVDAPRFQRVTTCLGCHLTRDTLGVPGLLMFSTIPPANDRAYASASTTDQRSPLEERWGGWFVTGSAGPAQHMGNKVAAVESRASRELATVDGLFDMDGYRRATSDIAALMVLSHQTHMTNLITRAGWEARASDPTLHPPFVAAPGENARIAAQMRDIASEVVDYLLFIDEAPLAGPIRGSSGFTERFSTRGVRDAQGRSLHQLDLNRRLMRYPCSYLIYSAAFDGLPPIAKDAIYARMWQVLSGEEQGARYRTALSLTDRQSVVDILRETRSGLPDYFRPVIR
jgi:hypothetical protein